MTEIKFYYFSKQSFVDFSNTPVDYHKMVLSRLEKQGVGRHPNKLKKEFNFLVCLIFSSGIIILYDGRPGLF